MMKKLLTGAAVVLALSAPAQAEMFNPYIGFDVQRTVLDYGREDLGGGIVVDYDDVLADGLTGVNLHVGNRFNKYFGAELGYSRTREESKTPVPAIRTKIKMQSVTLDALGYVPVAANGAFELIGTAGVAWSKADVSMTGVGTEDSDEVGFRAGLGAQYHFTDNVSLRGIARFQTADFDDVVDRAWVYSAGLNYAF